MYKSKEIRILLIQRDMTVTQLANKLGMGQSTLSKKLKKDDFTQSELQDIATALDVKYISYFQDNEGKRI